MAPEKVFPEGMLGLVFLGILVLSFAAYKLSIDYNCEINILDMNDAAVSSRAKELGIARVPAVVVNGKLADCCQVKGPTKEGLKAAGIGN